MTSEATGNDRNDRNDLRGPVVRRVVIVVTFAALLVTFAFATGCAGRRTVVVWEKPGATAAELEEAREVCLEEPTPRNTNSQRRDRMEADAMGNAFVACMEARGWTWKTRDLNE